MIPAVARFPLVRFTRTPRAWGVVLGWIAVGLLGAVVEKHVGGRSADRALVGAFAEIVLPLVSYGIVGGVVASDGLARSTRALRGFGETPARAAGGAIAVSAAITALVCAITASVVAAMAHGTSDPPLAIDMLTSAWVAAVGGAAYAAWFALGASLFPRGSGRTLLLFADWVFGSGDGVAALFTPRGHVRSLLGGEAVLEWSGKASLGMLVGLTGIYAILAVIRAARSRTV